MRSALYYHVLPILAAWYAAIGCNAQYDEYRSCGRESRQLRNARILRTIPCDLSQKSWCDEAGLYYPEERMQRFVFDNHGLMKRLYGDENEFEMVKNEIQVDNYNQNINLGIKPNWNYNRQAKVNNNYGSFNHFRTNSKHLRIGRGRAYKAYQYKPINYEIEKSKTILTNVTTSKPSFTTSTPNTTTGAPSTTVFPNATIISTTTDEQVEVTETDNEMPLESTIDSSTIETFTDDNTQTESRFSDDYYATTTQNFETEGVPPLDAYEWDDEDDSLSYAYVTSDASTITPGRENNRLLTPEIFTTFSSKPHDTSIEPPSPSLLGSPETDSPQSYEMAENRMDSEDPNAIKKKIEQAVTVNIQINTESKTNKHKTQNQFRNEGFPEQRNRNSTGQQRIKPEKNTQKRVKPPKANKPPAEEIPKPQAYHSNIQHEQQKFEKSPNMKTEDVKPETLYSQGKPTMVPNGFNACPSKATYVHPFWANNTKGDMRAVLNIHHYEQFVHTEVCEFPGSQMYCKKGCRCEQQYRTHKLLAYDPHNECRGIFSDWFPFPSSCVCKCYEIDPDDTNMESIVFRQGRQNNLNNGDLLRKYAERKQRNRNFDDMDVDGWGRGGRTYRLKAPKNIRPQVSPMQVPRPKSHIQSLNQPQMFPSSVLTAPIERADMAYHSQARNSNSIYRNQHKVSGFRPTAHPPHEATLGTLDTYQKPYFKNHNLGSLYRPPRSVNQE